MLRCPICDYTDRENCDECEGRGEFELTKCPSLYVSGDVVNAIYAARQAEHGCWPVAGGWMDQTQKCLDAIDFIKAEEAELKNREDA